MFYILSYKFIIESPNIHPLYKLHMSNFSSVHDSFGAINSSLKLERSVLIGRYKLNVYKNLLRKYLIFDQTHSRTAVDVKWMNEYIADYIQLLRKRQKMTKDRSIDMEIENTNNNDTILNKNDGDFLDNNRYNTWHKYSNIKN